MKSCQLLLLALPGFLFAACGGQPEHDHAHPHQPDAASGGEAAAVAVTPPPGDSAEETVRYVVDGLLEHQPERVWAALPDSYQQDIHRLITGFSEKLDADMYDRGFALVGRAGEILQKQKELFLASSMLPEAIDRAEAAANWDGVTALVRTLASSEIARVDTLATLDPAQFLGSTGRTLLAEAERAAKVAGEDLFEELRNLSIEVIDSDGETATLRLSGNSLSQEIDLVRIENRWVPRELAEEWGEVIAGALAQIEEMSLEEFQAMKPQVLAVYGIVEGVLSQLEAAETVQQLDSALQMAMFSVMGMFMGSALQGMGEFELTIP